MRFVVSTLDLRRALRAVAPHIDPVKEFTTRHRVRVEVGPENATVSATNGYTAGHALVSIWDNEDGELGHFDLAPNDVKEILAVFPSSKPGDDVPDDTLRLELSDELLTITDVSGLFPGKALAVPRCATDDNFPDVARLIGAKITAERDATARLVASGAYLALFAKAAAAYAESLVIDPGGPRGAMLITCGESFVGMLTPVRVDDEQTAAIHAWHTAWLQRLDERVPAAAR